MPLEVQTQAGVTWVQAVGRQTSKLATGPESPRVRVMRQCRRLTRPSATSTKRRFRRATSCSLQATLIQGLPPPVVLLTG